MKKLIALFLILAMAVSFAACAANEEKPAEDDVVVEDQQDAATNDQPEEEKEEAPTVEAETALTVLENVWAAYGDDEKFPVIGGNIEAPVDGAPGTYDMAYAENMTFNLLIPADQIANVTEVASMIHMMNANSFTCGAFHLAEGVSVEDFAAVMQSAVQSNQWMCGFPENLTIANVDGVNVIVAFGVNDAMNPFKANLSEAYPEAVLVVDEAIA